MGQHVSNQGAITARLGTVALAAGSAVTLTFAGNSLLHLRVDQSVVNSVADNGGLIRAECPDISSRPKDRCTRLLDGGCFVTDTPGRHSRAGRIGRGTNPPPQFGQTLPSLLSTQSAQNVHS